MEVQLPDLSPGQPHEITLAYRGDFIPSNRAWLPMGSYLRLAGGRTVELPPLPRGVAPADWPEVPPFDGLRLIPRPDRWEPAEGSLQAQRFAPRSLAANGEGHAGEALEAASALGERTGLGPLLDAGGVELSLETDAALPGEAYRLTIAPDGVTLAASDRAGVFHGAVTLLNLRLTHEGALPCGTIHDAPRFGWRGQHLDCARHFFEMRSLLRLLDLMALLKLNRFHWHFADDEAFRLEVDCAPELWQKTAFRGEGMAIPGVHGGGIRAGGSYSKADVASLLARARELGIEVLPEIEVPAHGFALNIARHGLRDPADNGGEVSVHGYLGNTINPAMPGTWELLGPLMEEVAGLFPIGILHLGCDELPPGTWDGSPAAAALKAREGLTSRDDLQGWMMERLAADLAARGIRPAAWEEAAKGANGGIGHGALLFSWTGQGPGVAAARAGHDVVMCPAQHVYLDMAHSADPADWGASWAAFVNLEEVVNWRPVPEGAEDIAPRVVGVQGTFWSEFTCADAELEPMLAPRILGVATKAWDRQDSLDGPGLRRLAGHYGALFEAMGWTWHRGA
jgi:hexosaminidase